MITRVAKCEPEVIRELANLVHNNEEFSRENFPRCKTEAEIAEVLSSSDLWNALVADRVVAIFQLENVGSTSTISHLCVESYVSLDSAVSDIRRDLPSGNSSSIIIHATPTQSKLLEAAGYNHRGAYVRYSRAPTQTNIMPLLPLTNPAMKQLSVLSQLMYDAYGKTDSRFPDTESTEETVRNIMSGGHGRYLSDASFCSGAVPSVVSACLLVERMSGDAEIMQVFTHPLYRARGLATTEITVAMNQLAKSGFTRVTMWIRESNDVVKRLLSKMDFVITQRVVEMESSG